MSLIPPRGANFGRFSKIKLVALALAIASCRTCCEIETQRSQVRKRGPPLPYRIKYGRANKRRNGFGGHLDGLLDARPARSWVGLGAMRAPLLRQAPTHMPHSGHTLSSAAVTAAAAARARWGWHCCSTPYARRPGSGSARTAVAHC